YIQHTQPFSRRTFPTIEDRTGRLSENHQRLIVVLDWVKVETFFPGCPGYCIHHQGDLESAHYPPPDQPEGRLWIQALLDPVDDNLCLPPGFSGAYLAERTEGHAPGFAPKSPELHTPDLAAGGIDPDAEARKVPIPEDGVTGRKHEARRRRVW
ncbi:MAG: hypothetical protein OXN16_00045, partial [Gammaproteobacteria bacterium]|nr:hypothetical protein [Gammaproteobacteria bacterium]